MVVVKRFRSVWGVESGDGFKNWISWFPDLKNQGYGLFLLLPIIDMMLTQRSGC